MTNVEKLIKYLRTKTQCQINDDINQFKEADHLIKNISYTKDINQPINNRSNLSPLDWDKLVRYLNVLKKHNVLHLIVNKHEDIEDITIRYALMLYEMNTANFMIDYNQRFGNTFSDQQINNGIWDNTFRDFAFNTGGSIYE